VNCEGHSTTTLTEGGRQDGMRVLETRVYRGPNPYGYRPVVRVKLSLGELEAHPTHRLEGFTDALLGLIPSLQSHGCSHGHPGGFVRRLQRGTWLAHVMEHVAIELQSLAGTPVTYGKTRGAGERGVYNVVYSYLEERVGWLDGWRFASSTTCCRSTCRGWRRWICSFRLTRRHWRSRARRSITRQSSRR
jgi:hypothetical protein